MKEIYEIIGRIIEKFQIIENSIALLIYLAEKEKGNKKALTNFDKLSDKTLGCKLKKIEKINFFEEENDLLVLDFLREKRNYVVHEFFVNNKYDPNEIELNKRELLQIVNDAEIIVIALNNIIKAYNDEIACS